MRKVARWIRRRWLELGLLLALAAMLFWAAGVARPFVRWPAPTALPIATALPATLEPQRTAGPFDGEMALTFLEEQVAFGPRPAGSESGRKTAEYIADRLEEWGWKTEVQEFTYHGVSCRNIVGRAGTGPVILLGAHYDTRRKADKEPDEGRRGEPVLGANDGGSGVAVLLELARTLDTAHMTNEVWLTFFDAEDNGGLDGWAYSAGSEYMAANLKVAPTMVVILDMIGDADQNIYKEQNSTPELQDQIWAVAARLGYEGQFIPEYKWTITDDHIPFLRRGYPAVDMIDFDYPFWHTAQDTTDKVSAASLERVGRVLQAFLEEIGKGQEAGNSQ
jgi:glutaminyl-peptide cyclotransferase